MLSDSATFAAFRSFLTHQASALRSIANRAGHEITVDDVRQDAWLIAVEIGKKRGHVVDFSSPDDQSAILAWLTNRLVKFASKILKIAVRMDAESDQEGSFTLSLPGPKSDDPLYQLLQRERVNALPVRIPPIVLRSYSEASTYAVLLARFDGRRSVVAKLLGVTISTLRKRLHRTTEWIAIQPSLFDGVVHMAMDFLPMPYKKLSNTAFRQEIFEFSTQAETSLIYQLTFDGIG